MHNYASNARTIMIYVNLNLNKHKDIIHPFDRIDVSKNTLLHEVLE